MALSDTEKRRQRHAFEAVVGRDAVLTGPHEPLHRAYVAGERA